jgi:predicted dehydrogenase
MVLERASVDASLRVGVVGLGTWGSEHLRAWQAIPGVTVTGLCDRDSERLREVGLTCRTAEMYQSVEAMAAADVVDVVSIANDERERVSATLPFIAAGVHALIEKPVALDLESARTLADAAKAAGTTLMPGHVLRFDVRFAALKSRIDFGDLGSLRSIYARRLIPKSRYWQYDRTHPLLMATLHDLDLVRWLFGADPLEVSVYSQKLAGMSMPDLLWCILRFAEDRIAVVETAFVLPDEAGTWLESETEVIGTEGVARVLLPSETFGLWLHGGSERPETALTVSALGQTFGALKEELSYLAQCVQAGDEPTRVTFEDGISSLAVALAAVTSANSGSPQAVSYG